jgi:hypothetical protein
MKKPKKARKWKGWAILDNNEKLESFYGGMSIFSTRILAKQDFVSEVNLKIIRVQINEITTKKK